MVTTGASAKEEFKKVQGELGRDLAEVLFPDLLAGAMAKGDDLYSSVILLLDKRSRE